MENYKYIVLIGALVISSIIYQKLNKNKENDLSKYYLDMISKYLINNNSLGIRDKPFLWIHLHNNNTIIPEVNQRHWLSFSSRSSRDFNQPYQYLTIKSIINKCGNDFNICLIDDESFQKILPHWTIDLTKAANPIRTHLRYLAIANILKIYGGMFVPSSFICFKSLRPLYNEGISTNKMFIGEFTNKTTNETPSGVLPSPKLMGCRASNNTISNYIKFLEVLNSTDFSADVECVGKIDRWFNDQLSCSSINLIKAEQLGIKNSRNNLINIEQLLGSSFVELDDDAYGLYIPWNELINRTSLEWFVRLSPEQVLESDTNIGKYLLSSQ